MTPREDAGYIYFLYHGIFYIHHVVTRYDLFKYTGIIGYNPLYTPKPYTRT